MPIALVSVLLLIVVVIAISQVVVVVPAGKVYVVERLGRFNKLLTAGLHIVAPLVDQVRTRIPLDEQSVAIPDTSCPARDGVPVRLTGRVRFRVVDAERAVYKVANYADAVPTLVAATFEASIRAGASPAALLVSERAAPQIHKAASDWGVEIIALEPSITLPQSVEAEIRQAAQQSRDDRIAGWARQRGETIDADGRPTAEQRAAYDQWLNEQLANVPAPATATGPTTSAAPTEPSRVAIASSPIPPNGVGLVELGGRMRSARNTTDVEIPKGARCRVEDDKNDIVLVAAV